MFAIENILDDVILRAYRSRLRRSTVTLKCCQNLECLFMLALADEQTGRVWEKGTERVDAEGEEELEGEGEAPGDVAGCEGKS